VRRPLALVGTTASGKSAIALEVARRRSDIELVSVDSMQVYRGMDIGTAKPTPAEQAEVPHHLIDLADPDDDFSVARFQASARDALAGIEGRGHRALLVGGTGLHLRAVVDGLRIPGRWPEVRAELEAEAAATGPEALHARLLALDPVAAARMEPTNVRRIVRALEVTVGGGQPFSSYGPGLDAGFLEEVRVLAARPAGLSRTARQALGYRELLAHVEGPLELDEAVDLAVRRTRRFARRQRVWFRRDPRIRWLPADEDPSAVLEPLLRIVDEPPD
jgi:tRNA dimethylallyltransferase